MIAKKIHITGIVQGVGFRPFIYQLAKKLELRGTVSNTSAGVDITIAGPETVVDEFISRIPEEAPPLSNISGIHSVEVQLEEFVDFSIIPSKAISDAYQPISADVTICDDCLRELLDPKDRRYRYPFINCTNCGPRFTIIKDIPYDRPYTTMAEFALCDACMAEYQDPMDRRFHAQPVACSLCGPQVTLYQVTRQNNKIVPVAERDRAIQQVRGRLQNGEIVAIKGLGGYHLACDATNEAAVQRMRERKGRSSKPFAIMANDIHTVREFCKLSGSEESLLTGKERPILLLEKIPGSLIAENIAPGQNTLGVMLPYTPLHYLLLEPSEDYPLALVMTSGNISEEPIAYQNDVAFNKLVHIADAFLTHDRPIHTRCDDSVIREINIQLDASGIIQLYPIRRSRGYAPTPVQLKTKLPEIFAAGPELKNTFCLTKEENAFVSHHIGDMENYETLTAYEKGVEHYERLFRISPEIIAYDLHPNYLASIYAKERAERENIPAIGIQHHHAHIASCLADNNRPFDDQVIGVSLDGTGYGTDGKIWGGEFLLSSGVEFERHFHLQYLPLPGGDISIQQPWRTALAYLDALGFEWDSPLPPIQYLKNTRDDYAKYLDGLRYQVKTHVNTVLTSSMGRLFDAVSALLGVSCEINYEAQAAIGLENIGDHSLTEEYRLEQNFKIADTPPQQIWLSSLFEQILKDQKSGQSSSKISAKLHNTLATLVVDCCIAMRIYSDTNTVALSGGVWQNMTLLEKTYKKLDRNGFEILIHRRVPANDGGISLGQAVIASQVNNRK